MEINKQYSVNDSFIDMATIIKDKYGYSWIISTVGGQHQFPKGTKGCSKYWKTYKGAEDNLFDTVPKHKIIMR